MDKTKPQDPFLKDGAKQKMRSFCSPTHGALHEERSFCRDNSFQNCSLLDSNPSRVRLRYSEKEDMLLHFREL
jgi:hypothetical protein